eukprot:UN19705
MNPGRKIWPNHLLKSFRVDPGDVSRYRSSYQNASTSKTRNGRKKFKILFSLKGFL